MGAAQKAEQHQMSAGTGVGSLPAKLIVSASSRGGTCDDASYLRHIELWEFAFEFFDVVV